MKVGDLVESFFDGTYGYGIVLEIVPLSPGSQIARCSVKWLDGITRWELPQNLYVIGEA